MRSLALVLVCLAAAGLFIGCSSQPKMSDKPITGAEGEPQWVTKGVNAFPDQVGKAIYGVGVAERKSFPTEYLRRKAAVERGRLDVAGQMRTLVQGIFKDYSEAALTESMDEATARNLTEVVQKSVVDEVLYSSTVEDMWVNPGNENYYALVRLSSDAFAEKIRAKMVEIEKNRLRVDAEQAHKDLDAIIEKYRNAPIR